MGLTEFIVRSFVEYVVFVNLFNFKSLDLSNRLVFVNLFNF